MQLVSKPHVKLFKPTILVANSDKIDTKRVSGDKEQILDAENEKMLSIEKRYSSSTVVSKEEDDGMCLEKPEKKNYEIRLTPEEAILSRLKLPDGTKILFELGED